MGDPGIVVQPVGEGNFEASVQFLTGWVSDGAAEAGAYLAGHAEPAGACLIAVHGADVAGYVAIVWEPNFAGFRDRGIPLVHQLAVAGPFRRHGVATLLMDAAERLACGRGVTTLGVTVGLFDEYGPAQRLYGRRGYVPDGRGVCQAQRPLGKGMQVIMDDDLIMWLTKELACLRPAPDLRAFGALGTGSALIAAGARPGAATLCCRCGCWREAQVAARPGDQRASGTTGRGHLRACDADREQLIDTLKDAFALGQLTRDELVARAGRALTSRTCAELAAIAADIPAPLTQARPRPQRARKPAHLKAAACGAGLIIAPPSLWAVFLTYYGGFIVLFLAVFAGLAVTTQPAAPGRK